jgi:hypothetical protein
MHGFRGASADVAREACELTWRNGRKQARVGVREPVGPEDICFDCPSPVPGKDRERYMSRCVNAMNGHRGATADVARAACALTWSKRREQARAVVSGDYVQLRTELDALRTVHEQWMDYLQGEIKSIDGALTTIVDGTETSILRHNAEVDALHGTVADLRVELATTRTESLAAVNSNLVAAARMAVDVCNEASNLAVRKTEIVYNQEQQREHEARYHEELAALHGTVADLRVELAVTRTESLAALNSNLRAAAQMAVDVCNEASNLAVRKSEIIHSEEQQRERDEHYREELAALRTTVADLRVELAAARTEGLATLNSNLLAAARMAVDVCNEASNLATKKTETIRSEEQQRELSADLLVRVNVLAEKLERLRSHEGFRFARENNGARGEGDDGGVVDLPQFLPPPHHNN